MTSLRQAVRRHPELPVLFATCQITRPRALHVVIDQQSRLHLLWRALGELGEVLKRDEKGLFEVARVSHDQFVADPSTAEQIHRFLRNTSPDTSGADL